MQSELSPASPSPPSTRWNFDSFVLIGASAISLLVATALYRGGKPRGVALKGGAINFVLSSFWWLAVRGRCKEPYKKGVPEPKINTAKEAEPPIIAASWKGDFSLCNLLPLELIFLIGRYLDLASLRSLTQAERSLQECGFHPLWKEALLDRYGDGVAGVYQEVLESHPGRLYCLLKAVESALLNPIHLVPVSPAWHAKLFGRSPTEAPSLYQATQESVAYQKSNSSLFLPVRESGSLLHQSVYLEENELASWGLERGDSFILSPLEGVELFWGGYALFGQPLPDTAPKRKTSGRCVGLRYQVDSNEHLFLIGQESETKRCIALIKSKGEATSSRIDLEMNASDLKGGGGFLYELTDHRDGRKLHLLSLWSQGGAEHLFAIDLRDGTTVKLNPPRQSGLGKVVVFGGRELMLVKERYGPHKAIDPLARDGDASLVPESSWSQALTIEIRRFGKLQLLFARIGSKVDVWNVPQEGDSQPSHLYSLQMPPPPSGWEGDRNLQFYTDTNSGHPCLKMTQSRPGSPSGFDFAPHLPLFQ